MAINWTRQVKRYRGLWIGFKRDERTVIASGRTAKAVVQKAKERGYERPILFRVPKRIIPYIGGFSQLT